MPPQTLAVRSRQRVSGTSVRIVARWKVNRKHGHPIRSEQGQRLAPTTPTRFSLKGNRLGETSHHHNERSCKGPRTWLGVYVNSMHLAACSQQLPLAPERLRRKWSETVVNELASKTSSVSPPQCPATHWPHWFHAEQNPTQLSEAITSKCFSQPAVPQSCFLSWNV